MAEPNVLPRGVRVHPVEVCERDGYACPFHRPSHHHMVDWTMIVRLDRGALVERVCPHGTGHPDPDSVRHLVRLTGATHWGSHGCCGCCTSPDKPVLADVR
jgi:hypothetical protein